MITNSNIYSEVTPDIIQLAKLSEQAGIIDSELFTRYEVKRGLRDLNGKGVLAGLTNISDVRASKIVDGASVPIHGKLFYRGYNVEDLVKGFSSENRFGFEEVTYLLLFDQLPDKKQLAEFKELLSFYRSLPTSFVRDVIMKAPSKDMMNTLARSVLTLYSYDDRADDTSLPNVLRQSLQLISLFPLLSIYGYQAYRYYHDGGSLHIHQPVWELSTAENILHILRPDCKYTPWKQGFWILPWFCIWNTVVETTLPLPPMWFPLRLRIPTPPLLPQSAPLRGPDTEGPTLRWFRCLRI